MPAHITSDAVWKAVEDGFFAVLSWNNRAGEPRSAGVVYTVDNRELYASTSRDSWKARHIAENPAVAVTVTFPKRIPLMPWIKIPAAVVSFHGEAKLHEVDEVSPQVRSSLLEGLKLTEEMKRQTCMIRIVPIGHFVTYGVGVSLRTMRDPEAAKARVPVAA